MRPVDWIARAPEKNQFGELIGAATAAVCTENVAALIS